MLDDNLELENKQIYSPSGRTRTRKETIMKKAKHMSEEYKDSIEVVVGVLLCCVAVLFFIAIGWHDIVEFLK